MIGPSNGCLPTVALASTSTKKFHVGPNAKVAVLMRSQSENVCMLHWRMPYDKNAFAVGGVASDNEQLGLSKQDTEESRLEIHALSFRAFSVGRVQ